MNDITFKRNVTYWVLPLRRRYKLVCRFQYILLFISERWYAYDGYE